MIGRLGFAAAVVLLASCSTDSAPTGTSISPAVVGHFRGAPGGVRFAFPHPRHDDSPSVAWARDQRIYVVTMGSGSCPSIPRVVAALSDRELEIRTTVHDFHAGDNACTGDLGPTTSVVQLPHGMDLRSGLTVVIDGRRLDLPAR